jgi:geranylgeranyl pyrophosphate synthase
MIEQTNGTPPDDAVFRQRLLIYRQRIDDEIAVYSDRVQQGTLAQYGEYPGAVTDVFLDILARGGKRLRGALVCLGYEMSGGTDRAMITRAAMAIEMLHAYILIIDDIQDRSDLRRGKPTAHRMLEEYHQTHKLQGDGQHAGVALALDAALAGAHAAQMVLANLKADPELRLKALSIINRTMTVTAHGQTQDIMNELLPEVTAEQLENVLEWKTASYSILNPLHVGMVFAGADCYATDAITPYAIHTGKAFQITDDILGVFGDAHASGKNSMDDIREGKRTLLSVYALQHAPSADAAFLRVMLGNETLTARDFDRCKVIMRACGAEAYAQSQAADHIQQAIHALAAEATRWDERGVTFLQALALSLPARSA